MAYFFNKMTLKKKFKKQIEKQKKAEKILRNKSKTLYYGHIKSFFAQSETTFSKQFFLNLILVVLFKALYFLETGVSCVANCITPLEVQILDFF